MKLTDKLIREAVEEFDKMTDDLEGFPENYDSLYEIGGPADWIKKNTDKHLFEDEIYGEPMLDLSSEKVKSFLETKIRQAVEEAFSEGQYSIKVDNKCDCNACRYNAETLKKKKI